MEALFAGIWLPAGPGTKCHGPATPPSKRQLSGRQQLQKRKRVKLADPQHSPLYKDRWPAKARQEDRNQPKVVQKSAATKERDSRLSNGYVLCLASPETVTLKQDYPFHSYPCQQNMQCQVAFCLASTIRLDKVCGKSGK